MKPTSTSTHAGWTIQTMKRLAVALILTTTILSVPGFAQERSDSVATTKMTLPQTPQEHRDRAALYLKKAAEYRQEADAHRKMLEDYSKSVAKIPKSSIENPYIKEMRLHCEKYINKAEGLAREADEMAKFHQMRAKELEEK